MSISTSIYSSYQEMSVVCEDWSGHDRISFHVDHRASFLAVVVVAAASLLQQPVTEWK